MYKDLREKATKKVQAKMAFYICAIVFSFVTIILLMLSYYLPSIGFWLILPIPVFFMVLVILYFVAFGLPFVGELSEDWQEREIEKEMVRLYRYKKGTTSAGGRIVRIRNVGIEGVGIPQEEMGQG